MLFLFMKKYSIINIISIFLLFLATLPIIYLLFQAFNPHEVELKSFLIQTYIKNTLLIIVVSSIFTIILGSSLAWIVSFYHFKFRKIFKIILALPLAIPPYVAAYGYGDFFYNQGLFHKFLLFFGIDKYFDILNIYGAIFIYVITLYPYIYLICLSYYSNIDKNLIDNARILKAGFFKTYFKIGLPIAKIAISSGLILIIMEIISDFGVVDYYGVQAFSSGIYKVWLNYGDFAGAIRLSAIALIFILLISIIETHYRKKMNFSYNTVKRSDNSITTNYKIKTFIYGYLLIVCLITLILPILQLLYNVSFIRVNLFNQQLFNILITTILYCGMVGIFCSFISFLIANYTNKNQGMFATIISKLATMGYSVPGVIIALAVIFSFIDLDKVLVTFYRFIGITNKTLVLSTSGFILIFAYIIRFLAIAYNNIFSAYKKINPNIFLASHTLKVGAFKSFVNIDLPLLYPSLLISFALVFLEVLKELPITLMLKPYNVETLTSAVYLYMHNEQYGHVAFMSLMIILLGFITIMLIIYLKEKQNVKTR